MNQTTTTAQKEKSILKKVNKEVKKARKVALVNVPKPVRQAVKGAVKARQPPKDSHLSRWAKALARPFDGMGAICPVNFNVAPSLMNSTLRLTYTNLNFLVLANSTQQMTLFPGHGGSIPNVQSSSSSVIGSDLDAVAFHAGQYNLLMNGNPSCHVGPCRTSDAAGNVFEPFNACFNTLSLGGCTNGNTGASTYAPYDVAAPYVSTTSTHLRWQLVSMGVRIFNSTPQLSRGGSVVTVPLINGTGFASSGGLAATVQAQLEANPGFKVHGDCGDGIEVSWIPRLQDLAYWHSVVSGTAAPNNLNLTNYANAAMGVFFNNGTATNQVFTIQVVFNWMLAGNSIQSISQPSVVEPLLRAPIEQTVVHLANNNSTAATAEHVAQAASTSTSEGRSMYDKLSTKAYEMAMHGAHAVGQGIVDRLARGSAQSSYSGPLAPYGHGYRGY